MRTKTFLDRRAMSKHRRPELVQLHLGPLPHEMINAVLGLELSPGHVVFSVPAQKHAYRRHADDFARCLPYVGLVLANPLYIGNDFRNTEKIELISRVLAISSGLLVAVSIQPDGKGRYHVASMYPISETKIQSRLRRGFVLPNRRLTTN